MCIKGMGENIYVSIIHTIPQLVTAESSLVAVWYENKL